MIVVVLGLWALGAVASAWVWVLVRMLRERRDVGIQEPDPWVWPMPDWGSGDTVPMRVRP